MSVVRDDRAPWLLLPCILLTLSGVSVFTLRQPAQAAPPAAPKTTMPPLEDDGDGDELLEHWGDPKYSREARLQMAGLAGGFLLIGASAYRRRSRIRAGAVTQAPEAVTETASEAVTPQRKAA